MSLTGLFSGIFKLVKNKYKQTYSIDICSHKIGLPILNFSTKVFIFKIFGAFFRDLEFYLR